MTDVDMSRWAAGPFWRHIGNLLGVIGVWTDRNSALCNNNTIQVQYTIVVGFIMAALKQDAELKEILGQLEFVNTGRTFRRWKTSFLTRWEEFLEQENIEHADNAYQTFAKHMSKFVTLVEAVNQHVANQDLTAQRTTVKGRNSLNEMNKNLTLIIDEHDALIPQTNQLEKKCGYNKFHMGAILIRDNFKEYGRLTESRDTLQQMRTTSLNDVADKQILEEMDNFATILQKFCDVMADLGLFGTCMLSCVCSR